MRQIVKIHECGVIEYSRPLYYEDPKGITAGELRQLLAVCPDDARILIEDVDGEPTPLVEVRTGYEEDLADDSNMSSTDVILTGCDDGDDPCNGTGERKK